VHETEEFARAICDLRQSSRREKLIACN